MREISSTSALPVLNRMNPKRTSVFLPCSRLIDSIRKSDGQQGTGVLSQAWDLTVNDEDDWRDELREASGVGRRKKKSVCTPSSPYRPD